MFLYVLPLRAARLSLLWIPIRVPSVFHPWLKDLLLHCFQGRVFDRWRRSKTEPAFRISSTSPGFGRSRLSFKSGAYCRPPFLCGNSGSERPEPEDTQGCGSHARRGTAGGIPHRGRWSDGHITEPSDRGFRQVAVQASVAYTRAAQTSAQLQNQVRPVQQDREPVEHVPDEQGMRFVGAREGLDRDRIQLPDPEFDQVRRQRQQVASES